MYAHVRKRCLTFIIIFDIILFMNHILKLQAENAALRAKVAAMEASIRDFQIALAGDKFKGVDPTTGERKDWISTSETERHLAGILTAQ